MPTEQIQVVGLREFQRELRQLDKSWPKELRQANLEAARLVVDRARVLALAQGGVAAKAAPSLKALGEQRRARVQLGGNAYPFAMGAEFGSERFKQFKPWRGNSGDAGYFLFPAKREKTDDVVNLFGDMVQAIIRRAFPD